MLNILLVAQICACHSRCLIDARDVVFIMLLCVFGKATQAKQQQANGGLHQRGIKYVICSCFVYLCIAMHTDL
jgi:hypothetical protein